MATNEGDNNHDPAAVYNAVAAGESADEVRRLIDEACARGGASAEQRAAAANQAGEHEGKAETPLRAAARLRRGDLVIALLEAGADIARAFHGVATPLAVCAAYGQVERVRELLLAGDDPEEQCFYSPWTGFGEDKSNTRCAPVQICIEPPILRFKEGGSEYVPPHLACLEVLVREGGADVNARDSQGKTALHRLASTHPMHMRKDIIATLQLLLDLKADVNAGGRDDGLAGSYTPLFAFLDHDEFNDDCMRALVRAGARVTGVYDREGNCPLAMAAYRCSSEAIGLLIDEAFVPVDERNPLTGATPLITCCTRDDSSDKICADTIPLLLDAGADKDAAAYDGRTALLLCAGMWDSQAAEVLLERNAAVDVVESVGGFTPLLQACAVWRPWSFPLVEELARRSSPQTRRAVARDGRSAVDVLYSRLVDLWPEEVDEVDDVDDDHYGHERWPQEAKDVMVLLLASGAPVLPQNAAAILPLLPAVATQQDAELAARRSEARRWRAHDDVVTLALEEADLRAVEARVREMERRVRELEEEERQEEEAGAAAGESSGAAAASSSGGGGGDDEDG